MIYFILDTQVEELTNQLSEIRQAMVLKDKNCAEHIQLLNEAGEEYTEKETEIKTLNEKMTQLTVRVLNAERFVNSSLRKSTPPFFCRTKRASCS